MEFEGQRQQNYTLGLQSQGLLSAARCGVMSWPVPSSAPACPQSAPPSLNWGRPASKWVLELVFASPSESCSSYPRLHLLPWIPSSLLHSVKQLRFQEGGRVICGATCGACELPGRAPTQMLSRVPGDAGLGVAQCRERSMLEADRGRQSWKTTSLQHTRALGRPASLASLAWPGNWVQTRPHASPTRVQVPGRGRAG